MAAPVSRGIGLALSGGAARGIAHIAVLETLEREGIPIGAIAGTSAGSLVGALYAAGLPLAEIKRILLRAKWRDILELALPRRGLIASDGIFHFMESILPRRNFSDLSLPFAAVAVNLRDGTKVSLTTGSLSRAVQASCSLPVIFSPTKINNRLLVDGGFTSQIPVRTVREDLGVRNVVAVNVNYRAIEQDRLDNIILIAAHISSLWASRNAMEEIRLANAAINVDVRGIPLYDLSKAKELLRRGQKATEAQLPAIRALLEE